MSLRILVADEDALFRESVCFLLRSVPGWQVCADVATGNEALDKTKIHRPDLVILDSGLTGIDALETARRIRQTHPDTAVLILNRNSSKPTPNERLKAGARGCLLREEAATGLIPEVAAITKRKTYTSPTLKSAVTGDSKRPKKDIRILTRREIQILLSVVKGQTNKEMSEKLRITLKTIESHRASISRKLGLSSSMELLMYAIENKLISPSGVASPNCDNSR